MRVDLYATGWNQARMLPFFLRHYEPVVDRIFVYDGGSDDGSLAVLRASPKVSPFRTGWPPGQGSDDDRAWLSDQCWKQSRGEADWVVIVDLDEHLDHDLGLRRYLAACRRAGVTVVPALAYEMVA